MNNFNSNKIIEEKIDSKKESVDQNTNLEKISSILEATYIDTLSSGHMGSHIYRFQRLNDKTNLIVKQAPVLNISAIEDIEANIFAYQKIKEIGGEDILPPELKKIDIPENQTLVMKDLGKTFLESGSTKEEYKKLWDSFEELVSKTVSSIKPLDANIYSKEIISHIEKYAPDEVEMLNEIKNSSISLEKKGKSAIMLLDFTPNNVFFVDEKMYFIDPWKQETYLGHPAVSIGQFTILAKIYGMKDSEENTKILAEKCFECLPKLLECSKESIELGLKLGSTLQLILSSYVRKESDPKRSEELINIARKKWTL